MKLNEHGLKANGALFFVIFDLSSNLFTPFSTVFTVIRFTLVPFIKHVDGSITEGISHRSRIAWLRRVVSPAKGI